MGSQEGLYTGYELGWLNHGADGVMSAGEDRRNHYSWNEFRKRVGADEVAGTKLTLV